MAGFDIERLALICVPLPDGSFRYGTGYVIRADLLLTASHVLAEGGSDGVQVRLESDGSWRSVASAPVWRDASLDAAIIELTSPVEDLSGQVPWYEGDLDEDVEWHSVGYPLAGLAVQGPRALQKTVSVGGRVLSRGGRGQGRRELELTVEAAAAAEQWSGLSGSPVFAAGRLAGIIKEAPSAFGGRRLVALPTSALLERAAFRLALADAWLEPPASGSWVLVVQSEMSKKGRLGLAGWVESAISKRRAQLASVLPAPLAEKVVQIRIEDALASPGRWLQLVRALCAAPIAAFDATGFEPGVMMALGVRAVVRRGVTMTSTSELLTPAQLSSLPFNIQETRLMHHGSGYGPGDVRHPLQRIPSAIEHGWQELQRQVRYMDLPAYDAVRCPYPPRDLDGISATNRMLVLCSFAHSYEPNWLHVANALLAHNPNSEAVRLMDLASPRLVGQSLYEGIRWATTCVVDWTDWRANVFFELGVRLACAELGPINIIEQSQVDEARAPNALTQKGLLTELLGCVGYRLGDDGAVQDALDAHDAIVHGRPRAGILAALPHDATYQTCRDAFEWRRESITELPHDLLRATIEAPFGDDPQAAGRSPLLFSTNASYSQELNRSIRERWLAAWYYLYHRHPRARWSEDPALREQLMRLGQDVLQFALANPAEPHLVELRAQIEAVLNDLQAGPVAPGERVARLKTEAKNLRDRGLTGYEAAASRLGEACLLGEQQLALAAESAGRARWAHELSDSYGLLGGLHRRWADATSDSDRQTHLVLAMQSYDAGFAYERSPEYGIVNTYNRVNRLLVRILMAPQSLAGAMLDHELHELVGDNVANALLDAVAELRRQLAGPRRGDYWAQADLALLEVLTGGRPAAEAYAPFLDMAPPEFAYTSVLSALQPLAALPLPCAEQLSAGLSLMRSRLERLRAV